MITSKQYDTLMRLSDEKETTLKNLYHGSGDLSDRAIDFAEASQEFERFVLSITEDKNTGTDEWIEWIPGLCPVPLDTVVDVTFDSGACSRDRAESFKWMCVLDGKKIDAYRIVRN